LDALGKLGINPIYLLSQIVVFSVLAFLLVRFLFNPILSMMDKRRERIAKGLEDARAAEEARSQADQETAKITENARKKAQQIVAEANTSADQVRANIEAQANEQAKKILAQAREDAELERNKILSEMRGQIGALSISAAQKIIGETLDEKRQLALVQEFFSGIKVGKIALADALSQTDLSGEIAVVPSALPLSEAEQESYQATLVERLGRDAQVIFRTDPAILGGVSIQIGDQVVDDSVAGKLEALKGSLAAG